MKRVAVFLLLCFLCFSVTACNDPSPVAYPFEELKEGAARVELINYDSGKTRRFDFDKMEVIEVLDAERKDDFFRDLSEVTMWNRPNPGERSGIGIRIVYDNGDFEVIMCNNTDHEIISYMARFDSEGKLMKMIGSIEVKREFIDLIDRYFTASADQTL